MKKSVFWLIIFGQLLLCSCIYDRPKGDEFYRTLWTSEEAPLGPVALEFLCDGHVCITSKNGIGSYGKYETFGQTAYFISLRMQYDMVKLEGLSEDTLDTLPTNSSGRLTIVIEEAHRTDDLLLLSWHFADSGISYSTRLVRLSSYE